jgi:hypothetical protein
MPIPARSDEIKIVGIICIEKVRSLGRQMKSLCGTMILIWRTLGKFFHAGPVKRRPVLVRRMRVWTGYVGNEIKATLQPFIYTAKLAAALQLVCGDAESGQHNHEDEAVPDLQAPADGVKDFHSMQ